MRLFVATDPSPEAVAYLRAALPATPGIRVTDPSTWHITLVFCGEVDASTTEGLGQRLADVAARHRTRPLHLQGSGVFGQALWVGVAGEVEDVASATKAAVRASGIAVEERRFRAHLTVGRTRDPRAAKQWVRDMAAYSGPMWIASDLRLVRSHLDSAGARHETLGRWSLAR